MIDRRIPNRQPLRHTPEERNPTPNVIERTDLPPLDQDEAQYGDLIHHILLFLLPALSLGLSLVMIAFNRQLGAGS